MEVCEHYKPFKELTSTQNGTPTVRYPPKLWKKKTIVSIATFVALQVWRIERPTNCSAATSIALKQYSWLNNQSNDFYILDFLEIARFYKALKIFADLQGPICYNEHQNKGISLVVY